MPPSVAAVTWMHTKPAISGTVKAFWMHSHTGAPRSNPLSPPSRPALAGRPDTMTPARLLNAGQTAQRWPDCSTLARLLNTGQTSQHLPCVRGLAVACAPLKHVT